jgi:hypothetical protein
MVYKATQEVVRRVMPLLDQLAVRTVDKARLLQYLSARAGADWGALELVGETEEETEPFGGTKRAFIFRDPISREEHRIPYPICLPDDLEGLVREEYKRLAADRPLTVMAPRLFREFYEAGYCASCRWRGEEHAQIHRECHYAGRPVNYEPFPDDAVG